MNQKIAYLRAKLNTMDMQGMIISNPINIQYLIGIKAEGILLLTRKENIYITDGRYIEEVNTILTIEDEIIVYDSKDITKYDYEYFFSLCNNVGFEEGHITYRNYKKILEKYQINNLMETEGIIEQQREIKAKDEIENIRMACKITDDCFEYIKKYIKIGMKEIEIADAIEKFFKNNGSEGLAFQTIVASGKNSSMPHAVPTNKEIQIGEPVTIDMGCKYKGYTSDMTRTIFMRHVPAEIKPIYQLVLDNQRFTLQTMKEACNIKNLYNMVENSFKFHNYSQIHALGHGVGLDNHELPFITYNSNKILKENMVVTSEPGIYLTGKFGVRIEDTVLINKNGCEVLTQSPKDIIIIDS